MKCALGGMRRTWNPLPTKGTCPTPPPPKGGSTRRLGKPSTLRYFWAPGKSTTRGVGPGPRSTNVAYITAVVSDVSQRRTNSKVAHMDWLHHPWVP